MERALMWGKARKNEMSDMNGGVPIFRQEGVTIDLVEMSRKRSGFQSTRFEPRNCSTTSPLVINHALHD
jgi:hypothetical protein